MAARIAELEDAADQARNRANKLEKDKNRLQIEVRDLTIQLESVRTQRHSGYVLAEKQARLSGSGSGAPYRVSRALQRPPRSGKRLVQWAENTEQYVVPDEIVNVSCSKLVVHVFNCCMKTVRL